MHGLYEKVQAAAEKIRSVWKRPPHAGIIVVEVPDTMPPDQRKQLILRQLATLAGQSLADTLVILEPGRVRIRR